MEEKKKNQRSKKIGIGVGIGILIIVILAGIFLWITQSGKTYEIETIESYQYVKLYQNNKYGVMDRNATILIEPNYAMVTIPNPEKPIFICYKTYQEETKMIETEVLNEKGEKIITQYEQVLPFVFKEATSQVPFEKSVLQYRENGKYGVIDFEGKKITEAIYDSIESVVYKEGTLLVEKEGKYGIITIKGKELIPTMYDTIMADGYYQESSQYTKAGFIVGNKTENGFRYGYCNEKGDLLLEPEYNEINRVTDIEDVEAYLIAYKNGKAGMYKNKREIVAHQYEDIEYNKISGLFLVKKGNKQGVIDQIGNLLLPVEQESILFTKDRIYATTKGEKIAYTNTGEKIGVIDDITVIDTENENYKITIQEGKYGVINQNKETIIKNNYSYIEYAFDDNFIVTNDGKIGILNGEGKAKVDFQYQVIQKIKNANILQAIDTQTNTMDFYNAQVNKVYSVSNASVAVKDNYMVVLSEKDRRYFDLKGNFLSNKEIYSENSLFASSKDGKWGFVNKLDEIKVEPIYDMVTEFNTYGFAGIKKDGKWGVINKEGTILVEPTYELEYTDPEFIGPYYKTNIGYGFEYYTNEV